MRSFLGEFYKDSSDGGKDFKYGQQLVSWWKFVDQNQVAIFPLNPQKCKFSFVGLHFCLSNLMRLRLYLTRALQELFTIPLEEIF